MFGRKSKQIAQEAERAEAFLRSLIDTLRDGDKIEVKRAGVNGNPGTVEVGTVFADPYLASYGDGTFNRILKGLGWRYTDGITSLRVIQKAAA